MLGLPLVPDYKINNNAGSAIFTVHALKEPGFSAKLKTFLDSGKPVLITDGLSKLLSDQKLLDYTKFYMYMAACHQHAGSSFRLPSL
jgi:hypothetical protein